MLAWRILPIVSSSMTSPPKALSGLRSPATTPRNPAMSSVSFEVSVMALAATGEYAGELRPGEFVADVADRVEAAARPFAVVASEGEVLGQPDRRTVIDVLLGRGAIR